MVGPCPGELFSRRKALELVLLSLITLPLITLPSVLQEEEEIADLRQQVQALEGRLDDVGRQRDAERAAAEAALGRAGIAKVVPGPVRALMRDVGSILAPVVRVPSMACS